MAGAGAGMAASMAMSALMLLSQRAGLTGKLPPRRITQRALDVLGVHRNRKTEDLATFAAHLGYGSACGALYSGVLRGKMLPSRPIVEGMLFGGMVWAASYFGWLPAAK